MSGLISRTGDVLPKRVAILGRIRTVNRRVSDTYLMTWYTSSLLVLPDRPFRTSCGLCWIRSVTSERLRYCRKPRPVSTADQGAHLHQGVGRSWLEIAPGVTAKVLSFDCNFSQNHGTPTVCPGTSYAPHRHTEVEELYVLEGGCSIAGREMTVGDYHRAEAGTEHHDTSSDDGCLLLVISSPRNEMLP